MKKKNKRKFFNKVAWKKRLKKFKKKIYSFKTYVTLLHKIFNFLLLSFKTIFILLIILLISSKFILSFIDSSDYRDDISNYVNESLGVELLINGDLELDLMSPNPKLVFNDVVFKDEIEFLKAREIKIEISLWELFFNKLSFSNLEVFDGTLIINKEVIKNIAEEVDEEDSAFKTIDNNTLLLDNSEKVEKDDSTGFISRYIDRLKFSFDSIFIQNFHIIANKKDIKVDALKLNNDKFQSNFRGIVDYNKKKIKIDFDTNEIEKLVDNLINDGEIFLDGEVILNGAKLKTLMKVGNFSSDFKIVGRLDFVSEDLFSNLKSFDIEAISLPTLKAKSNFIFSKNYLMFSDMKLDLGKSNLRGSVEGEFNSKRPNFKILLESDYIDLDEVLQYEEYASEELDEIIKKDKELNAFKDIPLFADTFNSFNVNVNLDFKYFVAYRNLNLSNTKFDFVLNDGIGILKSFKTNIADGFVDMLVLADVSDGKNLVSSLKLNADNVVVAKILSQVGYEDFAKGGASMLRIALDSKGTDLEELMANLNGSVKARTIEEMKVDDLGFESLSSDLLTTTLKAGTNAIKTVGDTVKDVFVKKKKRNKKKRKISCISTNLNIKDGKTKSDRGIAMESSKFNMVIDGYVDFKKEEMDVSILPVRKEGFKLGLNVTPLDLIAIKGSLAEPKIVIDENSLTREASELAFISLVLAPVTGATSLAATGLTTVFTRSLLDEVNKDEHPCRTAWLGKNNDNKDVKFKEEDSLLADKRFGEVSYRAEFLKKNIDAELRKSKFSIKKKLEVNEDKSLNLKNEVDNITDKKENLQN
ncbi:MAG: AsmA family protein [Alphaproteobacteria bacterium]|jgi:uncharacterized protein involved in outer membrane biogenesis|nr:AsmA family protein [Alphaproteobacteria bacterium]